MFAESVKSLEASKGAHEVISAFYGYIWPFLPPSQSLRGSEDIPDRPVCLFTDLGPAPLGRRDVMKRVRCAEDFIVVMREGS